MKLSLNVKLFISVSALLILIILTVILLNTAVLESYYSSRKEKALIDIYNQSTEYYRENDIDSTSDFFLELQRIDSTRNIEIVVYDMENNFYITSSNNFLKNGLFFNSPFGGPPSEYSMQNIISSLVNQCKDSTSSFCKCNLSIFGTSSLI